MGSGRWIIRILRGIADKGIPVVKVGSPTYRTGMGGGTASSMMQRYNASERDLDAVQRGNTEMAQKVYRVLRTASLKSRTTPTL